MKLGNLITLNQQKDLIIESLKKLKKIYPGNALEIRIPPIYSIQILRGVNHRKGSPPATVEMCAETWLSLINRELSWQDGVSSGLIHASGEQSDLTKLLEGL